MEYPDTLARAADPHEWQRTFGEIKPILLVLAGIGVALSLIVFAR